MLKKRNGGEVMGMATYEELLEIIKKQQTTIEKLTTELEETKSKLAKAEARIAELEEQLTIWHLIVRIGLKESIRSIVRIVLTGRTAPI